jgi:hypothetical protein
MTLKYLTFVDFFDMNFDPSFYSKYFKILEKIKYILKLHYVLNHIIVKVKIILIFNKMNSQS